MKRFGNPKVVVVLFVTNLNLGFLQKQTGMVYELLEL